MAAVLICLSIVLAGVAGYLVSRGLLDRGARRRASREAGRRLRGEAAGEAGPSRRRPRTGSGRGRWAQGGRNRPCRQGTTPKAADVEAGLPEMIDVVCLGLEGGMTFEASFDLYARRFDTALAHACRPAADQMRSGVVGKEEALGALAGELGSRPFSRFVEISLRSMRFGARLAPILSELADEVRDSGAARREEAIAKAPTKMLVPTGLLILPAMLLLIAGPFVLELLEQM